jgi:monoamine oxidase
VDANAIVMGAGFAGLTAARDLREAGLRVIVLEARERAGGRTWYRELPGAGAKAEYGGTWFSRKAQPHLAAEIERYGVPVAPPLAPTSFAWWVEGVLRTDDVREGWTRAMAAAAGPLGAAAGRIRAALEGSGPASSLAVDDVPVTDWVDRYRFPPETREFLLAFCAAMGGGRPTEVSMLPLLYDATRSGYEMDRAFEQMGESFAEGTVSLVDAIAAGADIRFGAVIERVRTGTDGVTVDLRGGGEVRGAVAVCALPLNVWADVRFDPALAPAKRGAVASGHPGRATKVLAVLAGAPPDFAAVGWGVPLAAMFTLGEVPTGRLATGFAVEEPLDPGDAVAVQAAVRRFLPTASVVACDGHDWAADPFSKGTWLAWPPGWGSDGTAEQLAEPEGRLLFASSDIAYEGAGWIEGAVASGRAAAARATTLMGQGGPPA